jgi:hypothetical protein
LELTEEILDALVELTPLHDGLERLQVWLGTERNDEVANEDGSRINAHEASRERAFFDVDGEPEACEE